jgi:hypothetical protein
MNNHVAPVEDFVRPSVCNGHPLEQALIRRWWHEIHGARGRIVWEYYLGESYADAVWFPDFQGGSEECAGTRARHMFPLEGQRVALCEAKLRLVPELIGQALVYGQFARSAGAELTGVTVFAQTGSAKMKAAAEALGLKVVLQHDA